MKKIDDKTVTIGDKSVIISIFKLDAQESLENLSRVYVIGANKSGEVVLIYNSKRNIWGFPGGHLDKGETVLDTARREFIEEVHRDIENVKVTYLLVNQLDGDQQEAQAICFAMVGEENTSFVEKDETVTETKFVPVQDVAAEVGNLGLWTDILEDFQEWFQSRSI